MRNSLARSLFTCRAQLKPACEKPWMNRISGPLGLPHSCAAIVTPSGVFTIKGLYLSAGCAAAVVAASAVNSAASLMAPPRVSCGASLRRGGAAMSAAKIQHLEGNERQKSRAYSPAVITEGGRIVWLAGQTTTTDLDGRDISGRFDEQARTVFAMMNRTLERAGASLANLVTMTVFIND